MVGPVGATGSPEHIISVFSIIATPPAVLAVWRSRHTQCAVLNKLEQRQAAMEGSRKNQT